MTESAPKATEPTQQERLERLVAQLLRPNLVGSAKLRPRLVQGVLLALILVGIAQFSADAWLGPQGPDRILLTFGLIPLQVLQGQWWRLFTAPWLHADPLHLLMNLLALAILGPPVEIAWGPARTWLIFLGSSMAGTIAGVAWSLPSAPGGPAAHHLAQLAAAPLSVGISGAIFGLLAAMIGLAVVLWPRLGPRLRVLLLQRPAVLLLVLLAVSSLGPRIDLAAHLGGALGGLSWALMLRPPLRDPAASHWRGAAFARLLAAFGAILLLTAAGLGALRYGQLLELPASRSRTVVRDGFTLHAPTDLRTGLMRRTCEKQYVDLSWALQTGRTPCWLLPIDGMLVLERRDRFLTLDTMDLRVLQDAGIHRQFRWRQPGVMLAPVGDRWLLAILAPDALLASQAAALQSFLPLPSQVVVQQADGVPWPEVGARAARGLLWLPQPSTADVAGP